jgi:hypothetical protein
LHHRPLFFSRFFESTSTGLNDLIVKLSFISPRTYIFKLFGSTGSGIVKFNSKFEFFQHQMLSNSLGLKSRAFVGNVRP